MRIQIWFILILLGMYQEQRPILINHEIFFLNATDLSTLMHVWGTDKFHRRSHFHVIKLIRQC